jgi:uncharacterized membrane protein HdeD (DUF308 family)
MLEADVVAEDAAEVARWWWVPLITGILWIVIGFYVLQAHVDSAVLVGYLVAVWLLFAGVAEFVELAVLPGWKWLHVLMGVLFILGGIAALLSPFQTFMVLAALIGFFLILKGTFDFVLAILVRDEVPLWWLSLIAGLIEIGFGIWATGYQGRSAALLLIWVGVGAILRGIVEIVSSVHLHRAREMAVAV